LDAWIGVSDPERQQTNNIWKSRVSDPDACPSSPSRWGLYVLCVQCTVTVPFVDQTLPAGWWSLHRLSLVCMQWTMGDSNSIRSGAQMSLESGPVSPTRPSQRINGNGVMLCVVIFIFLAFLGARHHKVDLCVYMYGVVTFKLT
jgi:hypothetical protein